MFSKVRSDETVSSGNKYFSRLAHIALENHKIARIRDIDKSTAPGGLRDFSRICADCPMQFRALMTMGQIGKEPIFGYYPVRGTNAVLLNKNLFLQSREFPSRPFYRVSTLLETKIVVTYPRKFERVVR